MPLVPLLPALSALVSLLLMIGLPWASWERLIIWMAIGIAFYFGYGHRRTRSVANSQPPTSNSQGETFGRAG